MDPDLNLCWKRTIDSDAQILVFHPSPMKMFGLVVATLLMVAACAFCTTLPGQMERIVGWIGFAFFSLALAVLPSRLFHERGPQIAIGPDGVHEFRQGFGFIPWSEVEEISVWQTHGTKALCLLLYDPAPFLERLPPDRLKIALARQALGATPVTLNFAGLTPDIHEAISHCKQLGHPVISP